MSVWEVKLLSLLGLEQSVERSSLLETVCPVDYGIATVNDEMSLIPDIGGFYSGDGTFTRDQSLQWPAPPEALGRSSWVKEEASDG
jgi:hypothetical protein